MTCYSFCWIASALPRNDEALAPVLIIPAKVYPGHNRCKQPVLMIPIKAIHVLRFMF